MKIKVLKIADALLGKLLVAVLSLRRQAILCNSPRRILLIRPGGIGDAVHLVPAIRQIKATLPDVSITILAEKRNSAIFSLCPAVDKVFLYDRPKDFWKSIRGRYDVVIDVEQWHRLSAVVARLAGAPVSVGYATNDRKRLFTHAVSYSHDEYEMDSFFRLLDPLNIVKPGKITVPFLNVPLKAADRGGELLARLGGRTFVVIFPGASIPERRWGAERFREVAKRLHARCIPVVIVGGKDDVRDGERIVSETYGLNLAGKTSLVETAAIIERAALLVSGDSGILHIGVGLGKPTVSLFGAGIEKKWAPRGEQHIVINKHLPCSPCTKFGNTPKCPINVKCMTDITVVEVVTAVEKLLFEQVRSEG